VQVHSESASFSKTEDRPLQKVSLKKKAQRTISMLVFISLGVLTEASAATSFTAPTISLDDYLSASEIAPLLKSIAFLTLFPHFRCSNVLLSGSNRPSTIDISPADEYSTESGKSNFCYVFRHQQV
jgi:hypothetical protein